MNIHDQMKARALREFDEIAAATECSVRLAMKLQGRSSQEIENAIAACRSGIAEQRASVGNMVAIELMQFGIPIEKGHYNERA